MGESLQGGRQIFKGRYHLILVCCQFRDRQKTHYVCSQLSALCIKNNSRDVKFVPIGPHSFFMSVVLQNTPLSILICWFFS